MEFWIGIQIRFDLKISNWFMHEFFFERQLEDSEFEGVSDCSEMGKGIHSSWWSMLKKASYFLNEIGDSGFRKEICEGLCSECVMVLHGLVPHGHGWPPETKLWFVILLPQKFLPDFVVLFENEAEFFLNWSRNTSTLSTKFRNMPYLRVSSAWRANGSWNRSM